MKAFLSDYIAGEFSRDKSAYAKYDSTAWHNFDDRICRRVSNNSEYLFRAACNGRTDIFEDFCKYVGISLDFAEMKYLMERFIDYAIFCRVELLYRSSDPDRSCSLYEAYDEVKRAEARLAESVVPYGGISYDMYVAWVYLSEVADGDTIDVFEVIYDLQYDCWKEQRDNGTEHEGDCYDYLSPITG